MRYPYTTAYALVIEEAGKTYNQEIREAKSKAEVISARVKYAQFVHKMKEDYVRLSHAQNLSSTKDPLVEFENLKRAIFSNDIFLVPKEGLSLERYRELSKLFPTLKLKEKL